MKKCNPLLFVFCLLFFSQRGSGKNLIAGPDVAIIKVSGLSLNKTYKKIYFQVEIKNTGTTKIALNRLAIDCRLSIDGSLSDDDVLAGGQQAEPNGILAPGESRIFKQKFASYSFIELEKYPYLIVLLDGSNIIAEDFENNNMIILKHGFSANTQVQNDEPSFAAPPELYPDLKLTVSDISSKIETNTQTGVSYRLFTFKCTVKNISNYVVPLDTIRRLTIQSYRVNTCTGQNLEPAGGRHVAQHLSSIKPGETIILENQTANQPVKATTRIRVELKYRGTESNLANNKACISL